MTIPFSQRYGYIKPEKVLIRERLTESVLNSTYNFVKELLQDERFRNSYLDLNLELSLKVLNLRIDQVCPRFIDLIIDEQIPWYKRIDYIEWFIIFLRSWINDRKRGYTSQYTEECNNRLSKYIDWLNSEYERHNYAYRIIDDVFVETTSKTEITTIQTALENSNDNVVTHLQECLRLISPSNQDLSTRNAIKEAISAVEVTARQITKTNTLDEAFKKLSIHHMIRTSMKSLYHYTNQGDTGIRHGWMEQQDEPTIDDAIFVLVTSCSFINFLNKVYLNPSIR